MNQILMDAVEAGDLVRTRVCLRSEPVARGDLDEALSIAVMRDRADLVNLLLDAGADPNDQPPSRNWGALHIAVEFDLPHVVALLVRRGADVNRQDLQGRTPLMHAVELAIDAAHQSGLPRSTEMIETLLGLGADPKIRDVKGLSPFNYASSDGFTECLALLRAAPTLRGGPLR